MSLGRLSRSRSVALLVAALVSLRALIRWTTALRRPDTADFADLLVAGSAWVLLGAAGWTVALGAAAACETWSRGRVRATSWVPCPAALRRALLPALGVALVSAIPSTAATAASGRAIDPGVVSSAEPGVLPVPDRPSGRAAPPPRLTVHPGDTLWGLATTRLPPHAPTSEVSALVHRLHEHNREVIGPDPDRIFPGQRLAVPTATTTEENR